MGNAMGKMLNESESEKILKNLKKQRKELEDYVNRCIEPNDNVFINATERLKVFDKEIALLQNAVQHGVFSEIKNKANVEYDKNLAKNYINSIRTSRINERLDAYEKNKKCISDYARRNHLDNTKFNLPQYYEHFDSNIKSLQENLEKGNLSIADKLPRNNVDIVETTSQYMNTLKSETIDIRIRNRIDTYDKQLDNIQSYVRKNHLEAPNLANEFAMDKQRLQQALQTGNYSSVSPLPDNDNDIIGPTTSYLNNMQQIQEMKVAINNMRNAPYYKKQNNTTGNKPMTSDRVTKEPNDKQKFPTRTSNLDPTPALKRLEKMSKNQTLPPRPEGRPSNDIFWSDYSNTSLSANPSMVLLDKSTKSTQKKDKGKAPASDSRYNSSYTSYKSTDSSRSNRPITPNNENKATYSGAVSGRSSKW